MKIAVTGSSGPLGMALNAQRLGDPNQYIFLTSRDVDLTHKAETLRFFKGLAPEVIIHLAAKSGSAQMNQVQPVEMFQENIEMVLNVLAAGREHPVKKILLCSSTAAYPSNRLRPAKEEDFMEGQPSNSDYPYAYAKRMMLPLALAYKKEYGLEAIVAVVNGIVGPGMHFEPERSAMLAGLIKRFLHAKEKEDLFVYGNGEPIREYTYSLDLARVLSKFVKIDSLPAIINIGQSNGLRIRQYAELVCEVLGLDKKRIIFESSPRSTVSVVYDQTTNNELLFRHMGKDFSFTDIKIAISETIKWYRGQVEKP